MRPRSGLQLCAWTTILCLGVTFPALAGTWTIETVDVGAQPSLAYDPIDRNPSVAYIQGWGTKAPTAMFAHWNGTTWVTEVIGPIGDYDIQLAYDTMTGQPAVVYEAPVAKGKQSFLFATRSPLGGWTKEVVDYSVGADRKLAFDPFRVPAIAYYTNTKTTRSINLARKEGTSWRKQTVLTVNLGTNGASWMSLAYDPAGNPAIAFLYSTPDTSYCLRFMHWNGASWDSENVECGPYEPAHAWGNYPSLAYAPNGEPAVASEGGGTVGWPRFARKSGTWATEVIDLSSTETMGTSLAFTPAGKPYVSFDHRYLGGGTEAELRVAGLEGDTWVTELVTVGPMSYDTSLAIDAFGEPSVAFTGSGGVKLARRTGP